jgi:hypothetical protein
MVVMNVHQKLTGKIAYKIKFTAVKGYKTNTPMAVNERDWGLGDSFSYIGKETSILLVRTQLRAFRAVK